MADSASVQDRTLRPSDTVTNITCAAQLPSLHRPVVVIGRTYRMHGDARGARNTALQAASNDL